MRTWITLLLLGAVLAALPLLAPARGQELGDVVAGERLAREVCAACHAVEKGDTLVSFEGAPAFQEVGQFLREHPGSYILLEGHTDSKGSEEYNLALSRRRAEAAATRSGSPRRRACSPSRSARCSTWDTDP